MKAGRLHNLLTFINEHHGGDLEAFLDQPLPLFREQLLSIKGIGRETADSILLYAAGLPVFVVDTYTHRILLRHQVIDEECGYDAIQELFMDNLVCDTGMYNEYHALLVRVGNATAKRTIPTVRPARCRGSEKARLPGGFFAGAVLFGSQFLVLAVMPEQFAADAADHAGLFFP
jgi:endonuclease III-like uncharacterized protein